MMEVEHDRRTGRDRRRYSPYIHIPERRTGNDRRKAGLDLERANHFGKLNDRIQHTDACLRKS